MTGQTCNASLICEDGNDVIENFQLFGDRAGNINEPVPGVRFVKPGEGYAEQRRMASNTMCKTTDSNATRVHVIQVPNISGFAPENPPCDFT